MKAYSARLRLNGVWKSQEKSHSILRAMRAIFPFWVDKKNRNETFWVIFKHCVRLSINNTITCIIYLDGLCVMAWPGCGCRGCGRVRSRASRIGLARCGCGCPSLVEQKSVGILWTHLLLWRQIFIEFGLFGLQGTASSSLAAAASTTASAASIVILQQRKITFT